MKPVKRRWQVWPPIVIARYWLHQSNRYLNPAELLHRWALESAVFVIIFYWLSASQSWGVATFISFLISHTASAVFNGHIWAMLVHDLWWVSLYQRRQPFFDYIDRMRLRLERKDPQYLAGAVFFGSLARGEFRTTSDMDIRFIAQDGFWNAFRVAHLVFLERLYALFAGFPIDIYMFQSEKEVHKKMDVTNESPVTIYTYGEKLSKVLPLIGEFTEFRAVFLSGSEPDRVDDLRNARSHVI